VDTSNSLGKVFSAGADLKERATMTQDQAADFVTLLRNTMERVPCPAVPVLAEVEGLMAVGGGVGIGAGGGFTNCVVDGDICIPGDCGIST
jgi:enoyl-CoA hydratase/carnithine racemase